jgi:phosphoserine phosphatase RsbU/P
MSGGSEAKAGNDMDIDRSDLSDLKERALKAAAEGIAISDARLKDMPLIYVNSGFERLTGYSAESVLGKNCRFLQGAGTDLDAAEEIRKAIAEKRACLVEILNYRKDGTPFWNRLSITPVYDGSGQLTHFIGIQSDITQRKNAEEALRQAKMELEIVNRRMKLELEAAARIQQTLLPLNHQRFDCGQFSYLFHPCMELAGDTFNVIPLDEYRIAFYIIDVSGHGVGSALLSVTLNRWLSPSPGKYCVFPRNSTDPMYLDITSPAAVAMQLNQQFQMSSEIPQYFTMLYGMLDQLTGDFRYVSAGHPGPILVPKAGNAECLAAQGFPIGLLPDVDYHDCCVRLQPGDRLYFYTDGVSEALDAQEQEFGVERIKASFCESRAQSLAESLDRLMVSLRQWRWNDPFHDDVTMLAVEFDRPVLLP